MTTITDLFAQANRQYSGTKKETELLNHLLSLGLIIELTSLGKVWQRNVTSHGCIKVVNYNLWMRYVVSEEPFSLYGYDKELTAQAIIRKFAKFAVRNYKVKWHLINQIDFTNICDKCSGKGGNDCWAATGLYCFKCKGSGKCSTRKEWITIINQ
jgi:hypothetical protein